MNQFANFDAGSSGSQGPWISWKAQKEKFTIRDSLGSRDFDGFDTGVVMDIDTMQTGWCYSSGLPGQAPQWRMNPNLSQFAARPGDEYTKGFKIRCAIGGGETAAWDQAGAGAWNAFVALVPALAQQPSPGMLPLVRKTGTKSVKFTKGSTTEPVLEVVKWVTRPDCLKEGVSAGIDVADDTSTAPAPSPAPQTTPPVINGEMAEF